MLRVINETKSLFAQHLDSTSSSSSSLSSSFSIQSSPVPSGWKAISGPDERKHAASSTSVYRWPALNGRRTITSCNGGELSVRTTALQVHRRPEARGYWLGRHSSSVARRAHARTQGCETETRIERGMVWGTRKRWWYERMVADNGETDGFWKRKFLPRIEYGTRGTVERRTRSR